jgi:hypothetical protein
MRTFLLIVAVLATAPSHAQQTMPQGWCDGEPDKADCAVIFQLCQASPRPNHDDDYCRNDATYCLLHYDADLCAAVQDNQAQEDIRHEWQFCIATAASKADAQACINLWAACIQEYRKSMKAPSRLTRDATTGRLVNAVRAAAAMKYTDCSISKKNWQDATTITSTTNRMK